ncbi:chaperone protein dnaJ 3 [Paracoccidioides lutzii Pb01]|uniref:Chaperone protein dnaJ 3 n=1 Tax=Paracoccidioides lutzii (strain ATCC MYA-826 / Pb01) TaxID=502779 RepID=C1H789_PARBA|nr:chaperone protein dnaJ 3 [Paracoccidioides lutzii Pb01]EEH35584.2 chaperone protein dnaJ 3 [Paracoccidioides lutzii Pb01]
MVKLIYTVTVLNIERSATKEEIRKAYRKAALAHHPDKVSPEEREQAEVRFKAVSQAYDILFDDQKRHIYDTHGISAFDGSGRPGMQGGSDLDDLLASMFGGGLNMGGGMPEFGGQRSSRTRKGQNEVQKYAVSLEDLYRGRTVKFSSTKNVICTLCKGKGGKERAKPKQCSPCGGTGYKETLVQVGPGMVTQTMAECKVCEGSGSFFQPKDKCKKCKGKKVTEERKLLEIYIPRGAKQGDKITLEGEGDQFPDIEPGDIVFVLEEIEHSTFRRAGADLMAEIEITLAEAICGFSRVVLKHLDGRGIEISHPKSNGAILRPNQVLKVAGEGMPFKKSDARGDLYLKVKITFPEDGWASDPTVLAKLREVFPEPSTAIEAETVDDVEYDPNANIEDFGSNNSRGDSGWEDEEEEEGGQAQCTTQ